MVKTNPNLFTYATSELSQDAFLAWLLAWADDSFMGELHDYGRRFLSSLFRKCEKELPEHISIRIEKQYNHIDVLAIVNETYYIIIEDKIGTDVHDDQLTRYRDFILSNNHTKEIEVLPIYLKFENQSNYSAVEKAGYEIYMRQDFLELYKDYQLGNPISDIFGNYIEYLRKIDAEYEAYKTLPKDKWATEGYSAHIWAGFYTWVQSIFKGANWSYVANPSGGFMGCWLGWDELTPEMDIYVQLEEEKPCFKVYTEEKEKRTELRDQAREMLQKVADEMAPDKVIKPNRLGNGSYMTIACLSHDVRVFNDDGKINLERTKDNIQLMLDIVAKTVESAKKAE